MRSWLTLVLSFPVAAQAPAAKDLRLFYQENCVRCHGVDGAARDVAGARLKGQDFTDKDWARSTKDEAMVKTILKGKFFGLAMPAFKDKLTPDEARSLVTEVLRKAEKGRPITPEK
jgi:mono/diheme cytochrome c family protein